MRKIHVTRHVLRITALIVYFSKKMIKKTSPVNERVYQISGLYWFLFCAGVADNPKQKTNWPTDTQIYELENTLLLYNVDFE